MKTKLVSNQSLIMHLKQKIVNRDVIIKQLKLELKQVKGS